MKIELDDLVTIGTIIKELADLGVTRNRLRFREETDPDFPAPMRFPGGARVWARKDIAMLRAYFSRVRRWSRVSASRKASARGRTPTHGDAAEDDP